MANQFRCTSKSVERLRTYKVLFFVITAMENVYSLSRKQQYFDKRGQDQQVAFAREQPFGRLLLGLEILLSGGGGGCLGLARSNVGPEV